MRQTIFSTYKTGENRVTASILAVLRSLSLSRIERVLGALMEDAEFRLVRFENQIKGNDSVPDAEIAADFRLLLETKIKRNTVRADQLLSHLSLFGPMDQRSKKLLVLTPDSVRPPEVDEVNDPRLIWASFAALEQAIDELLSDTREVVSERESFLLRELQSMLLAEGLLESEKDVVVVAAAKAWSEYEQLHAYICQAERPFQPVKYVAFYARNRLFPLVPRILDTKDKVQMVSGQYNGELGRVVDAAIKSGVREVGAINQVFLLSTPDSPQTIQLGREIQNDLRSESGRVTAFTQSQRYVSSDVLRKAERTSQLV